MIKNKKQLLAFTVVEMLIWLLITSCMLVLTFKVIRHNENNKIPTYIYYFYKNIQDASATIIDTLRQKEENHGKKCVTYDRGQPFHLFKGAKTNWTLYPGPL